MVNHDGPIGFFVGRKLTSRECIHKNNRKNEKSKKTIVVKTIYQMLLPYTFELEYPGLHFIFTKNFR